MLVEAIFVLVLEFFFCQDYMNKELFHLSVTDQSTALIAARTELSFAPKMLKRSNYCEILTICSRLGYDLHIFRHCVPYHLRVSVNFCLYRNSTLRVQ